MLYFCTDGKLACISYTHIYSHLVSPFWASFPFSFIPSLLFHAPQPCLTHSVSQLPSLKLTGPHPHLPAQTPLTHAASCQTIYLSDLCDHVLLCHLFTSSPGFSFQQTFSLLCTCQQGSTSLVSLLNFQVQLSSFMTFNQKA